MARATAHPLVQSIPSPVTDDELRQLARKSAVGCMEPLALRWISAIEDRDLEQLFALSGQGTPSAAATDLLGLFLTTITVRRAVTALGYWGLVRQALPASACLRNYLMNLLATAQLSSGDPYTDDFCENVWFAFSHIATSLPPIEKQRLSQLASQEERMTIREVSDSVLVKMLPEAEHEDALAKFLLEHLAARGESWNIGEQRSESGSC
jgi:hypothetical protein